jgi:hypothetical protein
LAVSEIWADCKSAGSNATSRVYNNQAHVSKLSFGRVFMIVGVSGIAETKTCREAEEVE